MSPSRRPNARAIPSAVASVGFAWLRSISDSIERLTPDAFESDSSDQRRRRRSSRTGEPKPRPGAAAPVGAEVAAEGGLLGAGVVRLTGGHLLSIGDA